MRIHFGAVVVITGVLCGTLAAGSAWAQGQGRGRGQGQGQAQGAAQTPPATGLFVFNDRDRELILKHYSPTAGLPPGLAKRGGDLPPGLEKQLRRNGTLPPGLQKKIQPFPRTLLDQLRPLPPGYRYGIVDGHVMVYRPDTYLISDIILRVVR